MGKVKILFCTYHETDCGLDNLFDGLCRVLGPENVYEYPTKPFLHGRHGRRWAWFPLFFDWPSNCGDDEKLAMLKEDKFDVIIYSNRIYQLLISGYKDYNVENHRQMFELVKEKSVKIPTFIMDQNDGTALEDYLIELLNARAYFKRDYLKDVPYDSKIIPLSFCYSEKYIPDINVEKTNTLFWIGRGYCGRTKYLDACKEITPESEIVRTGSAEFICGQKEYSQRLLKHKMGIALPGYGYGDMRYYELPAHGALLFSYKIPVFIDNDYTDMDNAVFFDGIEEMKDKLIYCLGSEGFVDRVRIRGYEWFKKYHTTKVRAQQLLDKINRLC